MLLAEIDFGTLYDLFRWPTTNRTNFSSNHPAHGVLYQKGNRDDAASGCISG